MAQHGREDNSHSVQAIGNRYYIEEFIGGGEFTEVYRVRDIVTGRQLALKTLRNGVTDRGHLNLSREFFYLSRINHPGVVAVYDCEKTPDNRTYFTMEYVPGVPITRYFGGGYSERLIEAVLQILLTLDAIHAQGLIHSDLKPEHILVYDEDGKLVVKLLDFGFVEEFCLSGENGVSRGTLGYVAPEVFKGGDADVRADLYSLGMVIYETLTGIGPKKATNLLEWLKRQINNDFPNPRSLNPEIPESLDRLVMQLINAAPERRPGSAQAVIEALTGEEVSGATLPMLRRDLMTPGFVARKDVLDQLKEMLHRAAEGSPGVVCISGDRGVGKSRILTEFKFFAELEGATLFSFEPASLSARSQSLIEALEVLLRRYGQAPAFEPHFTDIEKGGSYQLFELVTQRLKALVNSHRIRHSLVVIVDDFETFDPTSLDFLRYLALGLNDERLLLVVGGLKERRFLDVIEELKVRPYFRHLAISPFTREEVKELVISLLGGVSEADRLAGWLYEFTGGNPLWVIETVYGLIENKVVIRQTRGWEVDVEKLMAFRPPASVVDTIRGRLEGLSPEELEVLEIGAAAAGPFTLEFLRAVLNFEEKVLFNTVNRLKALGYLRTFRITGDQLAPNISGGWVISSKILETAITERLTVEQRRENHRRVALALELLYPDRVEQMLFDLAHHWTLAGVKERVYDYSLRAGNRARDWLLFEQALAFYENCLTFSAGLVSPRERIELMQKVGELRELTGRFAEAVDIYRQGMGLVVADPELARDKPLLAGLLSRLGLVRQKQGAVSEAINLLNQALHLSTQETLERAWLLADLGWSHCAAGEFDRAEELLTAGLQLAEKQKSHRTAEANRLIGTILYYFGVLAWARYDFVLALQLAERGLDIYERLDDRVMSAMVCQFIATLYLRRSELVKAKEFYQRASTTAQKAGAVYYLIASLQGLGLLAMDEGEWEEAEGFFSQALRFAEQVGNVRFQAELSTMLGLVFETRGLWKRAEDFYQKAREVIEKNAEQVPPESQAAVFLNSAGLAAKKGELEAAEGFLARAIKSAEGCASPDLQYNLAVTRAEVALLTERLESARGFLVQAFNLARRERDWRKLAKVYTLASGLRLAQGESQRAHYSALRALNLLREYPGSLEFAVALRCSGMAKCGMERMEKGVAEIRRSIEIIRRLGVKWELAASLVALAQVVTGERRGRGGMKVSAVIQVSREEFNDIKANLNEALAIYQELGARLAVEDTRGLLEALDQTFGFLQLKAQERNEYLKVFYQLSELLNLGLGREDFLDRVLDLVLSVTRAERGLIFLSRGSQLVPVAARDIDHHTLEDAQAVSQSVVRKVKRRGEPLVSADALLDPRLNSFNSVILNKIRSLLCVPLVVEGKVIGTIYLDSRITSHLFVDEDRNLLTAVANLLAATIERSPAFRSFQEEFAGMRENILVDAATGLFLGRSKPMRQVYQIIDRIAPADCTVLLTGETGTGKGVLARLIHQRSGRKDNKFVPVNCGTLPETLFESELFGHTRGSFTGAIKDKVGIFETAHGGTIFMDEITNTTLAIQAKLLQVLEEKVIRRVGETEPRMVDVRLICATNKNIAEEVAAGRFREDLYYRINVVSIEVPPLRERVGDIPHLAEYFLQSYATRLNKPILGFESDVIAAFTRYHWPGNVRELQNTIERAVIMTQNRRISLADVGKPFTDIPVQEDDTQAGRRRVINREQVISALKEANGNVTKAAELLSTHRRQLQRLIKRYQIDRNSLCQS